MRGLTVEDWASAGTAIMGVPTWRRLGAGPTYLHSTATRCADGCPSAALLDEIARRPATTRDVFTDELLDTADDIAARIDPADPEAAQPDALAIFGLLIGTLQLARALTDRDLSDQLLARGVETALKLLDDRA